MYATADCIGSQCENESIDDNGDKTHEFDNFKPNANSTFSLRGWARLTMQNRKRIQTNFNYIIDPAENGSRGKGSGKKHDVSELNDYLVEVTKGIVRVITRQDIRPSKLLVSLRYFSLVFELLYLRDEDGQEIANELHDEHLNENGEVKLIHVSQGEGGV